MIPKKDGATANKKAGPLKLRLWCFLWSSKGIHGPRNQRPHQSKRPWLEAATAFARFSGRRKTVGAPVESDSFGASSPFPPSKCYSKRASNNGGRMRLLSTMGESRRFWAGQVRNSSPKCLERFHFKNGVFVSGDSARGTRFFFFFRRAIKRSSGNNPKLAAFSVHGGYECKCWAVGGRKGKFWMKPKASLTMPLFLIFLTPPFKNRIKYCHHLRFSHIKQKAN